jgi:hypothetical protein
MKKTTSIIIGIFFIILMLGSILPYTLSLIFSTEEKPKPSLPNTNIIYEELNSTVEDYAVANGKTVIKFYFNALCTGCQEQKKYLEEVTSQNSGKIILEELTDNAANEPRVSIRGQRGTDEFVDATSDAIFDSLCSVMSNPPVDCALRNV